MISGLIAASVKTRLETPTARLSFIVSTKKLSLSLEILFQHFIHFIITYYLIIIRNVFAYVHRCEKGRNKIPFHLAMELVPRLQPLLT